ncbi:MAG: pantoate--beta-alanine ligase [Variibacter sp.]|nr:pantoate--beta-alanine ligase [Variibacter sp.]
MASRIPIARTIASLRRTVQRYRDAGESVALVPTMGALHAGHLALVKHGRKRADRVVVSIFVNPAQFAPTEDLSTYPRTFEGDVKALAAAQADLVWAPAKVEVMYPPGFSTHIVPAGPAKAGLEDAFRPHFFQGVATIVAKLLLQCLPDFAMFGEKDFQQLRVVQKMVADLDIPSAIVGVPTMRERDGLAMSSRNVYLGAAQRAVAPELHRALQEVAQRARSGEPLGPLLAQARRRVLSAGFASVDYIEARHAQTLEQIGGLNEGPVRLLAAAKLGATRLIDNIGIRPA